jgi:tetratricopeptide (TPR) repeat protein
MGSEFFPLTETKTLAVIKAWLYHCKFQSHYASSQKEEALKALDFLGTLPGLPTALELLHLFDLCSLANQFSLWELMSGSLRRLEELSRQTNYNLGLAQVGYFRAALSINEGRFQEAIEHYQGALSEVRLAGDRDLEAEILNDMGFCYRRLGDNLKGEEHYLKSLEIRREISNLTGVAESLNNLGMLYIIAKKMQKSEMYLTQALEIEMRTGDKIGAGYTLVNLGFLNKKKGSISKAETLFRQALDIRSEIGDSLGLGYCYLQLAHVAKEPKQADALAEESYRCFCDAGDLNGQIEARLSQAEIWLDAGFPERAFEVLKEASPKVDSYSEGPTRIRYQALKDKCRQAVKEGGRLS